MTTPGSPPEAGERFEVTSADGTPIAVWVAGSGRPLVMVHGAMSDHRRFGALVEVLRDEVTTYSLDRRGRGASGDAADYSIEREFEDVAAVIDTVAERTGGPIGVWGHSYGADCVMGAATLTTNASHLVLYEPGLGFSYPEGSVDATEQAVRDGDHEEALRILMKAAFRATDEDVEAMKGGALWPMRVECAPTVPRELRTEQEWVYGPGRFDGITAAALVLAGSESIAEQQKATRAAVDAVPGARLEVLEGHDHFAFDADPELIRGVIREFTRR